MPLGIESICVYLPRNILTSDELSERFNFSKQFVESKIGVRQIYMAGKSEFSSDLAAAAARNLFENRPGIRNQLDTLVVCTQTPDFQLPHTAAIVHEKLGLSKSVACFDVGLGCSGFVYGLSIVNNFLNGNGYKKGLLITAETYSKLVEDYDKNTKPLFSDAAAATLIGYNPVFTPCKFSFGTDGSRFDHLIARQEAKGETRGGVTLRMNGRGIFEFAAVEVVKDVLNCLKNNSLSLDEIDYFVFHQASSFMLDALAKKLGIKDKSKVVKNLDQVGNTVSSSIPIVLKYLNDSLDLKQKKILISGFGVGLSWASTILTVNGELQ